MFGNISSLNASNVMKESRLRRPEAYSAGGTISLPSESTALVILKEDNMVATAIHTELRARWRPGQVLDNTN
jgi:hypothetical protein